MKWIKTESGDTFSVYESEDGQWMIRNSHTNHRFGWNWKLHHHTGDHWTFKCSFGTLRDAKHSAEKNPEDFLR